MADKVTMLLSPKKATPIPYKLQPNMKMKNWKKQKTKMAGDLNHFRLFGRMIFSFFLAPLGRDRYSIENGNFFDGIIRASVMGGWRAFTKDTKTRDSQQSSIDPQSDGQNLSFCFLLYSCCVLCGANNSHIVPLLLLLREETFSSGNQTWHSGGEEDPWPSSWRGGTVPGHNSDTIVDKRIERATRKW
jgi:hypothetical protein